MITVLGKVLKKLVLTEDGKKSFLIKYDPARHCVIFQYGTRPRKKEFAVDARALRKLFRSDITWPLYIETLDTQQDAACLLPGIDTTVIRFSRVHEIRVRTDALAFALGEIVPSKK